MNEFEMKSTPLPVWLYVVGWIFFLYMFISILGFSIAGSGGNFIISGMYLIDFGVHEVSHIVMTFFPPIITAAAGSIGEICFTLLLLLATVKAKSHFAAVFAGQWVMLGFVSAGQYMADARAQNLPLIGPGETVQHDWHFVFSQLGWLQSDMLIGGSVRWLGIIVGICSLLFGIYFVLGRLSSTEENQS